MNSPKKVGLFGCKATTKFLMEALLGEGVLHTLVTINPEKGAKAKVADYLDLAEIGRKRGLEVYEAETYSLKRPSDQEAIRKLNLDLVFVVGWQRLLPKEVLETFSIGAFGMHGSSMNLPLGRGRSPMNWSIIEGKKAFYTNLFRYDPGVDSGQVLDTYKFQITDQDTGETMHFKNTLAMKYLVLSNLDNLLSGTFSLTDQPEVPASYYPKRTESDSLIDWREEVHQIERFVRAVAPPFNGAYTFVEEQRLRILRAQVFDQSDFGYVHQFPGQVVEVFPNGKFLVRCLGGLLLVHEYDGPGANMISKGALLTTGPETKKHFPRNPWGGFDMPE